MANPNETPERPRAARFAAFDVNFETGELRKYGLRIRLQDKPLRLLQALLEQPGKVVTRDELRARLWPADVYVDFERNLKIALNKLRTALCDTAQEPRYIETLRRRGYRFIAKVEIVEAAPTADSGDGQRVEVAVGATSPLPSVADRPSGDLALVRDTPVPTPADSRSPRRHSRLGVAALAVTILAGLAVLHFRSTHSRPLKPLKFAERDWVLIAHFDNRSGDPLLDGTLEYALERDLSNSRFVNVVPRVRTEDALRMMKRPVNSTLDRSLGREVCLRDGGIRALLAGRVEKIGSTYVLSAALVDPGSDVTLTTLSEEAGGSDQVLSAVRRLSLGARQALGENLRAIASTQEKLEKVTTPSLRGLQLYSQGMTLINEGKDEQAAEPLERAVGEDKDFASAHILLAHCYSNLGKEKQAAPHYRRAFELADSTPDRERYFILGSYYQRFLIDYEKAAEAYQALVRLYPDHFWGVNNLIGVSRFLGRNEDAARYAVQRAELRPNDFYTNFGTWLILATLGEQPAKAKPYLLRARKLASAENLQGFPGLAVYFELSGAIEAWQQGDPTQMLSEVNRVAETLNSRTGEQRYDLATIVGDCYLTLGRLKRAKEVFQETRDKLAWAAFAKGDLKDLRRQLDRQTKAVRLTAFGPTTAILLAKAGRLAESQEILSSIENEKDLRFPYRHIVQGELALARGRRRAAIELLRKGVRESPWGAHPYYLAVESLGNALEQEGDLASAIRLLEEASGRKERDGIILGWLQMRIQSRLARLYRKAGRQQDARRIEAKLAKLLAYADPDHPLLAEIGVRPPQQP